MIKIVLEKDLDHEYKVVEQRTLWLYKSVGLRQLQEAAQLIQR